MLAKWHYTLAVPGSSVRFVPMVAAVVLVIASAPAHADPETKPTADFAPLAELPSSPQRALSVAAAILPGLGLHGAGLYTLGDERGARSLLALEGIGFAMILAGGVPLALSGAARDITWPAVPLLVTGAGLFATSWLADLYGVSGLSAWAVPPASVAPFELEASYAYVRDVHFDYGHFTVLAARLVPGAYFVESAAWIALDADNQRWRLDGRGSIWDSDGRRRTFVELRGAATWHRYGDDGFSSRLAELAVAGRLELAELSSNLRGSYIELSTGAGVEWLRFGLPSGDEDDLSALLLGTFAVGAQLGNGGGLWADLRLFYDHRRDDFAAGLSTRTRGSGFAGHVGAAAHLRRGSWGLVGEAVFGGAHVYRLGISRSIGGRP